MGWILVVAASIALSLWRLAPPPHDSDGFSIDNALKHLRFIASERRPVDSPFHDQVRDYLVRQFRDLGYDTQTQNTLWRGQALSNVLARKPGQRSEHQAVMLAAHYDSVPTGPGAADDGAAVAALLDVARLLANESHRNDILFLITDAEETPNYLPGSDAFVRQHPWAKDVGVVFNFEARGSSGPSIMFETSSNNAAMIGIYARHAPHPVCSSLTYDVYKRMPNDTDFTIFRDVGHMRGLNFAFIGSYANYHTPNDDLNHLDPRSLRHSGLQALALARALLDMDLSQLNSNHDDIYWDVLSLFVIRYPTNLAMPIGISTAACAIAVVIFARIQRLWSWRWLFVGALLLLGNLVVVVGVSWLIGYFTKAFDLAPQANLVILGYALLCAALTLASFAIFRKIPSGNLWAAGIILWAILSILAPLRLPGGSYLTAWPLLCSATAFALHCISINRIARTVLVLLLCIPTVVFLAPMVYLAFLGLTLRAAWLLVPVVVLSFWLLPPMWIVPNTLEK